MHTLSLHQGLTPEQSTLLVTVKLARRGLQRYFTGEVKDLKALNSHVIRWLEERDYVEAVLDGDELEYLPTAKAEHAILDR